MLQTLLKRLLVFAGLICVLESTGVPLHLLWTDIGISQTEKYQANDEDDTSEKRESAKTRLELLWAGDINTNLLFLFFKIKTSPYQSNQHLAHLGWIAPVPTPPPNYLV